MNITQPAPDSTTTANNGINPKNLYSYQHDMPTGVLHCFLEHEEGEDEGPDKPGFESSMNLVHAMANGMDVAKFLKEEVVAQIEAAALKHSAEPQFDETLLHDVYENRLFGGGRCCSALGWLS